MAHSIDNLEKFLLEETRYVSLSSDYVFKSFDCGNADLNDFLLNDAKIYSRHLRYTTQILETDNQIVAYFSLANDLLIVRDFEDFQEEMDLEENTKIEGTFRDRFFSLFACFTPKNKSISTDRETQQ